MNLLAGYFVESYLNQQFSKALAEKYQVIYDQYSEEWDGYLDNDLFHFSFFKVQTTKKGVEFSGNLRRIRSSGS